MDIPNLSQTTPVPPIIESGSIKPSLVEKPKNSKTIVFIIIILAIVSGFWVSRFWPSSNLSTDLASVDQKDVISVDDIKDKDNLEIGKYYGDTGKSFTDTAAGTIEKGNINGEGTHILNREGGISQRASLISSIIDLDLFIDKKVEVKGETNTSNKTAWLLDVGMIKIIE